MELMQANREWSRRPDDERFLSLLDMQRHFDKLRQVSASKVVPAAKLEARPLDGDHKALAIYGPNGHGYAPTHWAFGQLAQLGGAPARYLRNLPAALAADNINYGLKFNRTRDDVGVLLQRNGSDLIRAVTGPNYGRIWNADVTSVLVDRFGDGINGRFRVPGEWGKEVVVTKANTTLYAGQEDMFVFLADEKNRVEVHNRRGSRHGSLARGAFFWNSEVGKSMIGMAFFLYDEVCGNRIVWGATEYREICIRHTVSGPDRWEEEMQPMITAYVERADSSVASIEATISAARDAKLKTDLDTFLAKRFSKAQVVGIKAAHDADEHRPMETIWDIVTGATAYARQIGRQDDRVAIERKAGEILDLVAA